jgi:hypothetical protein
MLSTPPMLVILWLKQMMRDVDHDEDDAGREDHSHVTN